MKNSKINNMFEWVWRILILNVLSIVISLLSLTILLFPCFIATFRTFKKIDDEDGDNIFKIYFKSMFEEWKKMLILTIIFEVLLILFTFNIMSYLGYFEIDPSSSFVFMLFVSTIFIIVICLAILIHIPLVISYFKLKTWHTIKLSIYMTGRYFAITGVGLCLIAFSAFMFLKLLVVWCFIGFSVPIFLIYKFSINTYRYLSKNLEDIKNSDNYDLKEDEE